MEKGPRRFDPDAQTRAVIDDLQRAVAQRTGEVPTLPFVTGSDGILHELVEYDVREDSDQTKEKIGEIERKLGEQ